MSPLTPDQERQAEEIEDIYKIFLDKIKLLETRQMELIGNYRKELERRKMAIIRKRINMH